jgi:hemerythrin-like domain-containing protein
MDAVEILRSEHALIRQFLDNLSFAVEKLERGERPPAEFFEKAVDFSRQFVDKHHHFKEEHVMFMWLAQKKRGEFDAPIDSLRFQHERGREHVTEISNALSGYAEGVDDKTTTLLENAAAYISMLRQHIHREDHVFYPMVKKEMSESEGQEMVDAFNEANRKAGEDFHAKYHELVLAMGGMLVQQ